MSQELNAIAKLRARISILEHDVVALVEKLENLQLKVSGLVADAMDEGVERDANAEPFILDAGDIIVKGQPVCVGLWDENKGLFKVKQTPDEDMEECYGIAIEDCTPSEESKQGVGWCKVAGIVLAKVAAYPDSSEPEIGDPVGTKAASTELHPEFNNVGILLSERNNGYALVLIKKDLYAPLYKAITDESGGQITVKRVDKDGNVVGDGVLMYVID